MIVASRTFYHHEHGKHDMFVLNNEEAASFQNSNGSVATVLFAERHLFLNIKLTSAHERTNKTNWKESV